MTPRRDRQAHDDLARWAASAATEVGANQRPRRRPVNWNRVAECVVVLALVGICFHLVIAELVR
jgi:hypothetical protein